MPVIVRSISARSFCFLFAVAAAKAARQTTGHLPA